jgi:hypothetical protein
MPDTTATSYAQGGAAMFAVSALIFPRRIHQRGREPFVGRERPLAARLLARLTAPRLNLPLGDENSTAVDKPGGSRPGLISRADAGALLGVGEPIERVVAALADRGVTFEGPVRDEGTLKIAFFVDPDGNPLYLAQPCAR